MCMLCSEIIWVVEILMSPPGGRPLWLSHFGTLASIRRHKSDNNSSLWWVSFGLAPLFHFLLHSFRAPEHGVPLLFPWRTCSCPALWWLNTEGHRLFLCIGGKGTLQRERAAGGEGGTVGTWGAQTRSISPLKVYLSKGSPTASRTLVGSVNVVTLPTCPETLSLIHTLKEVQQQCSGGRGGREGDVRGYIWSTLVLFIQRVVAAEDRVPSPCSSSSLINLAVWSWPDSRNAEWAGLSDHPPWAKAQVCLLGLSATVVYACTSWSLSFSCFKISRDIF